MQINHPLDCPICDQGGECDLQEQVRPTEPLLLSTFCSDKHADLVGAMLCLSLGFECSCLQLLENVLRMLWKSILAAP